LSTTQEVYAFTVFERVFKEFGLPKAIRTGSAKVTSFDGYVFVAPEYNHGCRPEVLRV
jgi:putative transposase